MEICKWLIQYFFKVIQVYILSLLLKNEDIMPCNIIDQRKYWEKNDTILLIPCGVHCSLHFMEKYKLSVALWLMTNCDYDITWSLHIILFILILTTKSVGISHQSCCSSKSIWTYSESINGIARTQWRL